MKNVLTKVLTITAVVLVLLIAVAATTLSIVQTNFNQVVNTNKVEGITVYTNGKDNYYSKDTNNDVFEKVLALYNKGTKESVLSALFQGAYSKNAQPEVVTSTTTTNTLQNTTKDTIMLKINFKETETLKINGAVQKDETIYGTDKSIYFNTVYLSVENNTNLTKITCYIVSNTSINYSYKQVKFVAHHSELFEYVENSDFPG